MARRPKPSGNKGRAMKRRAVNQRAQRQRFLIICEGCETELNYFKRFPVNADVKVKGEGYNTLSLVERAVELDEAEDGAYDQVWCVFDRDDFPVRNFNAALALAERKGFKVAYSNDAFEIWYLLHYAYCDTAIARDEYKRMLSKHLGRPYKKNDREMYRLLESRQADAIRNAQTLLNSYGPDRSPFYNNPSTTVHELVQELNKHIH